MPDTLRSRAQWLLLTLVLLLVYSNCSLPRYVKRPTGYEYRGPGGRRILGLDTAVVLQRIMPEGPKRTIVLCDYARTREQVFYHGSLIAGADPASFRVFWYTGYARDAQHVYYQGQLQPQIDPGTCVFAMGDVRDAQAVYVAGETKHVRDPLTFERMGLGWHRDKTTVYYNYQPVPSIDPASFRINWQTRTAHDTTGCYRKGKRVRCKNWVGQPR